MRILVRMLKYGTKAQLDQFIQTSGITVFEMCQMGLKRRIPDKDSWVIQSPQYEFDFQGLHGHLIEFVDAIGRLGHLDAAPTFGEDAYLSIIVVDKEPDEEFSTSFSYPLLQRIVALGLSLEIQHAVVMPERPRWQGQIIAQ